MIAPFSNFLRLVVRLCFISMVPFDFVGALVLSCRFSLLAGWTRRPGPGVPRFECSTSPVRAALHLMTATISSLCARAPTLVPAQVGFLYHHGMGSWLGLARGAAGSSPGRLDAWERTRLVRHPHRLPCYHAPFPKQSSRTIPVPVLVSSRACCSVSGWPAASPWAPPPERPGCCGRRRPPPPGSSTAREARLCSKKERGAYALHSDRARRARLGALSEASTRGE